MTAKDARTKWCPFASRTDDIHENAGVNRLRGLEDKHFPDPHCIVSDCMAWRWSYNPEEAQGNVNGPQGYCGLAGKPYG